MNRPIVVLDLETGPTDAALAMEPDESWLSNGIRDNFKPETVEKYRADNLAKWPAEISRRASLDWRLGRIIALGVQYSEGEAMVFQDDDEGVLLGAAWEALARLGGSMVGFNIRNFDLPWLWGRTGALGLQASRGIDARKYGGGEVIDWADILTSYGAFSMSGWSLARYAEWFGLSAKPCGTGADVAQWYAEGLKGKVAEHLAADLAMTWELHHRFAPSFLPRVA